MPETKSPVMTTQMVIPKTPEIAALDKVSLFDDSIEAKPLGFGPTDSVKKKNPNIELRGVNFIVGEGLRLQQMLARGWIVATKDDVEAPGWIFTDGAFKHGDLILMKHDLRAVLSARKYNALRAIELGGPTSVVNKGRSALREQQSDVSAPREVKSKMSVFVPGQKEVEGLVGKE